MSKINSLDLNEEFKRKQNKNEKVQTKKENFKQPNLHKHVTKYCQS